MHIWLVNSKKRCVRVKQQSGNIEKSCKKKKKREIERAPTPHFLSFFFFKSWATERCIEDNASKTSRGA